MFAGWRGILNGIGIALWLAALVYFWSWWLDLAHVDSWGRYVLVSVVLGWATLVPAYAIFQFSLARVPDPALRLPKGARIAMVVTKAPSEPWGVVRQTLKGALRQEGVGHDTWLADEDPTLDAIEWCERHGVKVSTRRNAPDYQRPDWPRRAHCKEGNLAYFYDHYGYGNYDFVAQFDADHVPDKDYLRHVMAPFVDPTVGYVSAPSICDSNAKKSWSARGRLYVEASLHGTLQSGYNAGRAPLCIGSHYAVRTAALKAVGGLGPELAEDHSTSLILNAGGWNGVHAIDAIAHGEGPQTFADLVTQEFQWARSLVTILLVYTPRYLPKIHGYKRFQFLFSQTWYPLFAGFSAVTFSLPMVALLTGKRFADVNYVDFFLHGLPLSAILLLLAYWWRSSGTFRPAHAPVLSWEGISFMLLRWPWSLLGSIAALWDWAMGRHVDFLITPKGKGRHRPITFMVLAPYLLLSLTSALVAWLVTEPGTAGGFYIYTLLNASILLLLILMTLGRHAIENRVLPVAADRGGVAIIASILLTAALTAAAVAENGTKGLAAMNSGITAFTLTHTNFPPSGAGQGARGSGKIRLEPKWRGIDWLPWQTENKKEEQ